MKPILFNTEMVRAIVTGTKTQTRRITKNDKLPFHSGDTLYVRETWAPVCDGSYLYRWPHVFQTVTCV